VAEDKQFSYPLKSFIGLRRDKQIAQMEKNHDKILNTFTPIFPRPAEALTIAEAFVRKFNKEFLGP